MTLRTRRFAWGVVAWELIVIAFVAAAFVHSGVGVRSEDVKFLSPLVVVGVLIVAMSSAVASRVGGLASLLLGFAIGAILVVAGGLAWAGLARGFETPPAIFIGSLLLSIPSGIGAALAGWLSRGRRDSASGPTGRPARM